MKKILFIFFVLISFLVQAQYNQKDINALKKKIIKSQKKGDIKSQEYANYLNELGILYYKEQQYSEAEALYIKALELRKEILGESHLDYASSLNQLGALYYQQGKYSETEPLYIKALEIKKNILGENHLDYLVSLNNLALLYEKLGKTSEAEEIFLKTLEIRRKNLGEKHPDYAKSLIHLSDLYYSKGKYNEAEPLCLKALEIRKESLGEKNSDYVTTLGKLASIYLGQKRYSESEILYLKGLAIKKEILGENHPSYLISLRNLASFYNERGKYSEAVKYYSEILEIRKNTLGEKHPDYIETLNVVAVMFYYQGKYSEAEPLYIKAMELIKEVFGKKNIKYATSINNLAELYRRQGKYSKAESLYIEAIEICEKNTKEMHVTYVSSLNNLALLYTEQRKYSEAESLLVKCSNIIKENFGEGDPYYAKSLSNLAGLYLNQEKYSESEPLYLKSLEIIKKRFGENHPNYATIIHSLAILYQRQDRYTEAEPLFLKALETNKDFFGELHPDYISILYDLADYYQIIGLNDKSAFYLEQYIKINQKRIVDDIYGFSENELIGYINFKNNDFIYPLSFLHIFPKIYPEINISCYENELLVKNLSLRNQERITKSIQKSNNKSLQLKYQQFVENKIEIKKLRELSLDERPVNFQSLLDSVEKSEKELSKESISFSDYKKAMSISWSQIKDKLKKDEVSVDLVASKHYNKTKANDSIVYTVFIVKRDYKFPKFISLFEEKQLTFLLERNKNQQDSTRIDQQYLDKSISNLFLKPLEKEFQGIKTIYLSPMGLGHQIDFSALPISKNKTLGEKYNLHILSSPAELVDYKEATLDKKSNLELILYGGIDYDKSETINNLNAKPVENNSNPEFVALSTRSGISKWDYLAGTQKEVGLINDKSQQTGFASTIINGRSATEESIKKLDGRTNPYVLHLATHGFFFADPKQELPEEKLQFSSEMNKAKIYKTSEDPMMRSGLLLAGANKYWNKINENITTDDGILTASEISNLDLSACQLVVLSACETGLGEVKGSEGVFGLQRAFKMAGVKNIIMSLWKVPDAQTAELFDIFYSECFAGKTIHEAFQLAQTKMKSKYSPYYWAGFVLLE